MHTIPACKLRNDCRCNTWAFKEIEGNADMLTFEPALLAPCFCWEQCSSLPIHTNVISTCAFYCEKSRFNGRLWAALWLQERAWCGSNMTEVQIPGIKWAIHFDTWSVMLVHEVKEPHTAPLIYTCAVLLMWTDIRICEVPAPKFYSAFQLNSQVLCKCWDQIQLQLT